MAEMAPFDHTGTTRWKAAVAAGPGCDHCGSRRLNFCAGLDERELARLSGLIVPITVSGHQTLLREGDAADYIYALTGGAVKLYKLLADGRRQITGFLFEGAFLGLTHNTSYPYTAEAITPANLCRFPRKRLEDAMDEFPRLGRRLLGLMVGELVSAHDQMLLLGRKTAREKVASFLIGLSQGAVLRGRVSDSLALPMSRTDIADHLGLTIETVSRTMTQFKREGILGIPDASRANILDMDRLTAAAEGEDQPG